MNYPWLQWSETQTLINAFKDARADMRFVGGAVRDGILNRTVEDVDVATPHIPEAVMTLLEKAHIKAIPTGIDHGTITAVINGRHFEITTLRRDVSTDGRHAEVDYTDDWKEDARRRDFTINALYLSPSGEVSDYFEGKKDLEQGRVRFIGDAAQRIKEDHLRILRFFRFHARYGKGEPDQEALAACTAQAASLSKLSGERIRTEMIKLLKEPTAPALLEILQQKNMLRPALGLDIHDVTAFARLNDISRVTNISIDGFSKLAGFLLATDISPDKALAAFSERLRFPNSISRSLQNIFSQWDGISAAMPEASQKQMIRALGALDFKWSVLLHWAASKEAIAAKNPYAGMLALANEWSPPLFPVSGEDLKALGVPEGRKMGELLKQLEEMWEAGDYTLSKEALIAKAKKLI